MKNYEKGRKITKRGTFILFLFVFLSIIILITLFKIQILGYDDYQKNVIEQLTVETKVNPLRGKIFDRNGVTLASNKTVWVLYLSPKNIKNPEFIAKVRAAMTKANVSYQMAELGKVDQGGGGTIAYHAAKYGMNVLDAGVAVLSMHAPWEVTSKADVFEAYRGYKAFLEG